jgi:glutamate N-acetyltransferase/amino-acid N-acetyltransferase
MSVTAAKGFRAAGVAAGIKISGGLDLALVVNDGPSRAAAGMFTRNQVKAAPVLWSAQVLTGRRLRAVALNSGGANACTGPSGFQDTHVTAERVATVLDCGAVEVAVCSTGLIGERLPIDAVLSGVDSAAAALAATPEAGLAAATAVLTTDTVPKQAAIAGTGWTVGGFAKGAGMVAPGLATMLCVLTTDAAVDDVTLDAVLRGATAETFERLDIDGTCSTNDTVLLLASGASGVMPDRAEFATTVQRVCHQLVKSLQADAEDSLVKTAFFGSDANWGRIAAAVGASAATVTAGTLDIRINGLLLCQGGTVAADRTKADLSGRYITVEIDLHLGEGQATVLTTDLSHGYVDENSAYSS